MNKNDLDALIFKAQSGSILTVQELASLVDELVMYRGKVHEMTEELKDMDNQINLRLKAEQELASLKHKVGL